MSSDETEKQMELVEQLGFTFPDFTIGRGDYGIPEMNIEQTIQGFSQEIERDRMAYNKERTLWMMSMTHAQSAVNHYTMLYNHALTTNNPVLANSYLNSLNESINQLNSVERRMRESGIFNGFP